MKVDTPVGTLADLSSRLLKPLLWLSESVIYPKYSQGIFATSVTVFVSSLLLYSSILDAKNIQHSDLQQSSRRMFCSYNILAPVTPFSFDLRIKYWCARNCILCREHRFSSLRTSSWGYSQFLVDCQPFTVGPCWFNSEALCFASSAEILKNTCESNSEN